MANHAFEADTGYQQFYELADMPSITRRLI